MIPIEVLKQVTAIYTHGNCPDGMASAMILKNAFRMLGMSPRIEFLVHNTEEHRRASFQAPGARALFCDISPHPDVVELSRAWDIVLDHHVGTREIVESFGAMGVFADEKAEPGVSGAVLAFREVWLSTFGEMVGLNEMASDSPQRDAVSEFARACGARDCWVTEHPLFERGQWISKMLMSKPATHWLAAEENPYRDHDPKFAFQHPPYLTTPEVEAGRALFEAHKESVRQAVEQCVEFDVPCQPHPGFASGGAIRLFVFQEQASGFRLCSDVAEVLRERLPHFQAIVAGFSWVVEKPWATPVLLYSLRGIGGFDVAAFAKAHGGGGHTAAAGFKVQVAGRMMSPYEVVVSLLREHLEKTATT